MIKVAFDTHEVAKAFPNLIAARAGEMFYAKERVQLPGSTDTVWIASRSADGVCARRLLARDGAAGWVGGCLARQ
jgi:hypothetical protein